MLRQIALCPRPVFISLPYLSFIDLDLFSFHLFPFHPFCFLALLILIFFPDGIAPQGGVIANQSESDNQVPFEAIKRINENGVEFWYARELQKVLQYTEWRNFSKVIDKAKIACENSNQAILHHFVDVNKVADFGGVAPSDIQDIVLTRYACYLIAQNGDSRKKVIAQAQSYFAIKTRERELDEDFNSLTENQKRLAIRSDLKEHNTSLAEAASLAGVKEPRDYAIFQNEGYKGLYGVLGQKEIHGKKGLKKSQRILDHMGSTELAANLFRATQTDEKLRRENIKGTDKANKNSASAKFTQRRRCSRLLSL